VRIADDGVYQTPSGRRVSILDAVAAARAGTVLYRPDDATRPPPPVTSEPPRFEVTGEGTGAALRRLVVAESVPRVAALNFASAKNPGGGFLGGAVAQEEDLARSSALYSCLLTQPDYYRINRAHRSMLYTDHVIYSPDVPFFRGDDRVLLEQPFTASIVTAPAPNAGEFLRRKPDDRDRLREALHRRAHRVLEILSSHGHRTIVLGAWGCGVFRNNPEEVADAFSNALASLQGFFERVVFAVFERSGDGPNLRSFREKFGAPG
jgi:uncharacterized protein (TIGR02452 family)